MTDMLLALLSVFCCWVCLAYGLASLDQGRLKGKGSIEMDRIG